MGEKDMSLLEDVWSAITWEPEIGDPTLVGWLTVLAYIFACSACVSVYCKSVSSPKRYRYFWLCSGILLLFLSVNKQLDLQSLLTDIGRQIVVINDWVDKKHLIQKSFIVVIASLGALGFLLIFMLYKSYFRFLSGALLGFTFLLVFILVRASSFHGMDVLISSSWYGIKVNWLLELSGIMAIFLNALYLLVYGIMPAKSSLFAVGRSSVG
ncbi:hypothetical protein QSV34_04785 [Porticoccus sp. W117]|uniref:hypothetical protein n=1 Tax=Porticoccus sp. W117 TaxID=3054777 RepID=UPI0025970D41|nr:hypothetical protein [Porticoccus sp. W117]MDM3870662.1 hypothetical protein [Porticoccus sp. W117]